MAGRPTVDPRDRRIASLETEQRDLRTRMHRIEKALADVCKLLRDLAEPGDGRITENIADFKGHQQKPMIDDMCRQWSDHLQNAHHRLKGGTLLALPGCRDSGQSIIRVLTMAHFGLCDLGHVEQAFVRIGLHPHCLIVGMALCRATLKRPLGLQGLIDLERTAVALLDFLEHDFTRDKLEEACNRMVGCD